MYIKRYLSISIKLFVLSSSLSISACGPIISTYVITEAQIYINEGEQKKCEEKAIYSMTAAKIQLKEARKKRIHSQFSEAIDSAEQAKTYAIDCIDKVSIQKSSPTKKSQK